MTFSERLFGHLDDAVLAVITATEPGLVAGTAATMELLPGDLGSFVSFRLKDGDTVNAEEVLADITAPASVIPVLEDHVLGALGFASGIATNARRFVTAAPEGLRIVCGGWKKLPAELKPLLRVGLDAAGVGHRLLPGDFLYIDKNGAAMLGGVTEAVEAGRGMGVGPVAIQVKERGDVAAAAAAGCGAVMVDSGSLDDLAYAAELLRSSYPHVVVAYGGGVTLDDLAKASRFGAQVVDVGRAILSSALLDLRLDVKPTS